ncbi:HIT family protein [[Clostridium] fimetarium]|uniref:Histidine triad (HIT) family protein n=1 Tax=[Clostridium] fimetarium TaxID=99656 RepID=A0A1I0RCN9_9FIRM|nr:HIT family protein [[Clostridium] fimetarium]SEW38609.1 histidine triad (HIT) family protein [[Clostridium] fimetarium]
MRKDDCIFCRLANGDIPTNALYEDDIVKAIFDLSPASMGHIIILPKEHFDNLYSIDEETAAHVFKVATRLAKAIKEALNCDGMNILQNNGEIAGQTVFHFHMHIIPRYLGDNVKFSWNQGKISEDEIKDLKKKIQNRFK